jgi:methylthioribose-1-phosphate isomerase
MTESSGPEEQAFTPRDDDFAPLRWRSGTLYLIDQDQLPARTVWLSCTSVDDVIRAIRDRRIRGTAIGCAAAYAVAMAARAAVAQTPLPSPLELRREIDGVIARIGGPQPTPLIFWALAQMRNTGRIAEGARDPYMLADALEARAVAVHAEDVGRCRRIGHNGAALVPIGAAVLTVGNAGALASGGHGTALGILRTARAEGRQPRVVVCETRPFLLGSRLTAWELMREGFDVTIIPDGAAAAVLRRGDIGCVIVGADRVAANGDVVGHVGTYAVALAASAAQVPFYVAAGAAALDLELAHGGDAAIEERDGSDLLTIGEALIAPRDAISRYPIQDVTPAALVSALVTDTGVARAPFTRAMPALD